MEIWRISTWLKNFILSLRPKIIGVRKIDSKHRQIASSIAIDAMCKLFWSIDIYVRIDSNETVGLSDVAKKIMTK